MTQLPHLTKKLKTPRGFVIIVVMLMLTVATAVALSQFTVVANQSVASVRVDEEIQARATGEACLALMQTYVENYIGTSPPGFNFVDFDLLLDRDRVKDSTDDFLPSFGTRTLVPRTLSPTTGATAAAHQWMFLPRPGPPSAAPNQAGCLLRLEDNSDDAFPTSSLPVGTTDNTTALTPLPVPSPEGATAASRDNPLRDRDRSIYITVIGLYPFLPGTAVDAAYERAHARVTLRRLFATSNPVETPPAILACDDVSLAGNASVTGLGGIQGDNVAYAGSNCGCGNVVANTHPVGPMGTCGASCVNPPALAAGTPGACTAPTLPNATYYMDNKGFGDAGSHVNNIGNDSTCKVHIDRWGRVFVWDTTDPYANDPSGPLGAFVGVGPGQIPSAPVHDCQNYTGPIEDAVTGRRIVEMPCDWDTVAAGGESVKCDFTNANLRLRQTPCWKPIAYLGDQQYMTSDVWLGPIPVGLNYGAGQTEMSSNDNDEDLLFVKSKPIPNIRDQSKMFATGLASSTMCGDPNSCPGCTGADKTAWWTECSSSGSVAAPALLSTPTAATCHDFHSHSHQNNDYIPWPVVFAWDVDPADDIEFEFEGTATKPLNATILSSGNIQFGAPVSFCCATCGVAGSNCTLPGTPNGIGAVAKFIPPASCVAGSVPGPNTVPPPPVPGPVQVLPSGYGYAFKTDGLCDIAGNSTVIGDVECKAINIPAAPCIVGNVLVTGSDAANDFGCNGTAGCASPANAANPQAGVCLGGNASLVGDIYAQGSVCATSNGTLRGDIFTMGNVAFASNFTLFGQIFANQDVNMAANSRVDFTGSSQILSAGNQGLTTFMETSW